MKKLVLAALAAMVIALPAGAADKIRIGTEGAYPPFNQIDAKGDLFGFDVDIAKALCAEMKADCEFVTQDWDGIIPALLTRKFDAVVASMSITEERLKKVDFTERYYSNSLSFIRKKGSGLEQDKLKGKVLGAQRATIAAEYIEKTFAKAVTIKLYDTQENAFLDLEAGRIDVMVVDFGVGYNWLHSDAGKGFEFFGKNADIDDRIGIALRKGETELAKRFNDAIKAIRANGVYKRINDKYFPFDIY